MANTSKRRKCKPKSHQKVCWRHREEENCRSSNGKENQINSSGVKKITFTKYIHQISTIIIEINNGSVMTKLMGKEIYFCIFNILLILSMKFSTLRIQMYYNVSTPHLKEDNRNLLSWIYMLACMNWTHTSYSPYERAVYNSIDIRCVLRCEGFC